MVIFKHAIQRLMASKLKLIILLVMPIAFAVMFLSDSMPSLSIVLADNDNTVLSQKLMDNIKGLSNVKVTIADEKAIDDKIISYQSDYAIIIEKGFEQSIVQGETPIISEFYIMEKEKLFYVRAFVNSYISDMQMLASGADHNRASFDQSLAAWEDASLSVANLSDTENQQPWSRGSYGFLVQFMLYMSVITAGLILEDRNSGVYYRMFFAPVTLRRYYAENLLAFTIIGSIQASFVITVLRIFFQLDLGSSALGIYMLFIVFALVCISLGMWLITMFKKPIQAYIAIIVLITPLVMLGGCYWPSDFMPDILQKIAKFLPTTWVMQAVDKVLAGGIGLGGIALELMVLMLFTGIFLAAGLVKKIDVSK